MTVLWLGGWARALHHKTRTFFVYAALRRHARLSTGPDRLRVLRLHYFPGLF